MKAHRLMHRRAAAVAAVMVAAVISCGTSQTAAQDVSGSYRTLDGRIRHTFEPVADYTASVVVGTKVLSFRGLYQAGRDVCLVSGPDGLGGGAGNVLLYVGGNECCLEFRPISDKVAVTIIGKKGDAYGPGYFLCNDQMLNRTSVGTPPSAPEPPISTARPRTLVPDQAK